MNMYEHINSCDYMNIWIYELWMNILIYYTYEYTTTVVLQPEFKYANTWVCSTKNWYNYNCRTKVWID